jgi:hypothetical protein
LADLSDAILRLVKDRARSGHALHGIYTGRGLSSDGVDANMVRAVKDNSWQLLLVTVVLVLMLLTPVILTWLGYD